MRAPPFWWSRVSLLPGFPANTRFLPSSYLPISRNNHFDPNQHKSDSEHSCQHEIGETGGNSGAQKTANQKPGCNEETNAKVDVTLSMVLESRKQADR
jgi:hypothetical protein